MMQSVTSRVLLVSALASASALLLGCGDDVGAVQNDAGIDSPPPLVDAPPPPVGHSYYVVDKVNVPATNTEARQFSVDLNGDDVVDNQLGMVLATLTGMGIETQLWFDKQVDTGKGIMLVDLYADNFSNASGSTFTIYQGANPMPSACVNAQDKVCRHHLAGSASFTALATPVDPPLSGDFVNGTLKAGPGHLTLQLAFPDALPTQLPLVGARVAVTSVAATEITRMILAGGVSQADIDSKLVPAMQVGFMAGVTRDCASLSSPPLCGCTNNTNGKTYVALFDADLNCAISVDEVRNSSLIKSLLAPDVMLENQMCLSIGVSAHAVRAGFVAPQ